MIAFIGWTMVIIALLAILLLAFIGGIFLWFFFVKSEGWKIVRDAWQEVKEERRTS